CRWCSGYLIRSIGIDGFMTLPIRMTEPDGVTYLVYHVSQFCARVIGCAGVRCTNIDGRSRLPASRRCVRRNTSVSRDRGVSVRVCSESDIGRTALDQTHITAVHLIPFG